MNMYLVIRDGSEDYNTKLALEGKVEAALNELLTIGEVEDEVKDSILANFRDGGNWDESQNRWKYDQGGEQFEVVRLAENQDSVLTPLQIGTERFSMDEQGNVTGPLFKTNSADRLKIISVWLLQASNWIGALRG